MAEVPKYYTELFNAVTEAVKAMDRQNYGTARSLLVKGQQAAEEAYIREEEE